MDSIIPCQAISFALLNIEVIFKEQNYHKAGWVCGSLHKELGFRRKKKQRWDLYACFFCTDTALLVSIFLFTFSWPAYTVLDPGLSVHWTSKNKILLRKKGKKLEINDLLRFGPHFIGKNQRFRSRVYLQYFSLTMVVNNSEHLQREKIYSKTIFRFYKSVCWGHDSESLIRAMANW